MSQFTVSFWNPCAIPNPDKTPLQREIYSTHCDFRSRIHDVKLEITSDVMILYPIHEAYKDLIGSMIPTGYLSTSAVLCNGYYWVVVYKDQIVTVDKTCTTLSFESGGYAMICSVTTRNFKYIVAAVHAPGEGAARHIRHKIYYLYGWHMRTIIGGTWDANFARDANCRELICGPDALKPAEFDVPCIVPYCVNQRSQDFTARQYLRSVYELNKGTYPKILHNHVLCSKEISCYSCPADPNWKLPTWQEYSESVLAKKMPWMSFSAPAKIMIQE